MSVKCHISFRSLTFTDFPDGVGVTTETDVACKVTIYATLTPPKLSFTPVRKRGVIICYKPKWTFTGLKIYRNATPGMITTHNILVAPIPTQSWLYGYGRGHIGANRCASTTPVFRHFFGVSSAPVQTLKSYAPTRNDIPWYIGQRYDPSGPHTAALNFILSYKAWLTSVKFLIHARPDPRPGETLWVQLYLGPYGGGPVLSFASAPLPPAGDCPAWLELALPGPYKLSQSQPYRLTIQNLIGGVSSPGAAHLGGDADYIYPTTASLFGYYGGLYYVYTTHTWGFDLKGIPIWE